MLAWTAAKMIVSEAFVKVSIEGRPAATALIYFGVIGGVLGLAWLRNRRATPSALPKERLEVTS